MFSGTNSFNLLEDVLHFAQLLFSGTLRLLRASFDLRFLVPGYRTSGFLCPTLTLSTAPSPLSCALLFLPIRAVNSFL
jgi:hypothetical protein